ncbi:Ig-like domain-containing protein [Cellulomonas phragmiteti]|uniref:CshA domain-containing protein n=1 Tax=Cellulomonas phragmiteti TaxID=478780 RepID=A0ABQ4DPQ9_9CELL|nr:DUF11 domain-containing protein [Cellulomonas phragmiteti]GIG41342.1 hypothetical protein Cph01nite_31040 [Cellulomonas phragmiteti]
MPLRQPPASPTTRGTAPHRGRRARRATTTVAALGLALGGGLLLPAPAVADPAPAAPTSLFAVGATVAGTVPDGVCSVVATVVGGAGGRSAAGANGVGSNGAGAAVTATFDVLPGTTYSGSVGGGGRTHTGRTGGAGGVGGGGAGGTAVTDHGGAGGGGLSSLHLGGTDDAALAVLAGGGGGSGGGHSITSDGFGGDAGLPTTPGQVAAGAAGTNGFEGGPVVGGGQGGGPVAPGAGGTHPNPALAGLPGVGRTGGAGAPDPNYDAGGGGGAGLHGGGGGASTTIREGENGITTVAGAGGGGGSSLVAASGRDVQATAAGRQTGTGNGADGSIRLDWVECAYDLAVTKTAVVSGAPAGSADLAPVGSTITWTVTVRNAGPQAMTRGDVVVLRDTLPGAGATSLTSATVSGGSNAQLARGPVTCDATTGAPLPAALTCSRPFAPLGGVADGARGLDVGETLTVVYTQQVTDAPGTVLANVASVEDRGDEDDNTATGTVTVIGRPVATDDEDRGNRIGEPVTVPVLGNDSATSGALDPASVVLWDADRGESLGTELVVPGEGTWTVDTTTGDLTFTPQDGFLVDPTPVTYRVSDDHGQTATALVTVTYVPEAADDTSLGHAIGTTVTLDVLANDTGDLDATSVRLVDGGDRVTTLVIPGEGTWTVDPTTGEVTFTPEDGFLLDPTPVGYEVTDTTGDTVTATVTVGYVPGATDDWDLDNPLGSTVTVDVLGNDTGDLDPATVRLVDGDDRVTTLVVPGQGTWTVDTTTGGVVFTPQDGYVGNPTPVRYEVTDTTGDTTGAQVTVTYQPEATDDTRRDNVLGTPVVLDPLGNDRGDLDPSTLRLVDPRTGELVRTLDVPGEGTWTVDPATGRVTFTPLAGYDGNPTPQRYEVGDAAGGTTSARLVVLYLPQAADDVDEGNVRGTAVTVDVVGNDRGTLDPTTVRLLDAAGSPVTSLTVGGEGTWTVDPVNGAITFTPVAGFPGDPTPVRYRVADVEGNPTEAVVRVTYVDPATSPAPTPAPTAAPTVAPTAAPTPAPTATPDLAVTGWGGWGLAALAGLLVVAGAGVLVLRRPTAG